MYLLFAGWDYGSYGGIWDLEAVFGTMEEAQAAGLQTLGPSWRGRWAHIVTVGDGGFKLECVPDGKGGWTEPEGEISYKLEAT